MADSAIPNTGLPTLTTLPHNNRLSVRLYNPEESYLDEETVSCVLVMKTGTDSQYFLLQRKFDSTGGCDQDENKRQSITYII